MQKFFCIYITSKFLISGSHLLSHTVSSAVPSAVPALTFVFGMGTGVAPGRIATGYLFYSYLGNSTVLQPLLLP